MIREGVHSHRLAVPQRPQMGEGKPHLDPVPSPPVRVAQDENPLADVNKPVGLQRELLPWRVELVIQER